MHPLLLLVLLGFGFFVAFAALYLGHAQRERMRTELKQLLGAIGASDRLHFEVEGRRVDLKLQWQEESIRLKVGVEVPNAGPDFTITRANLGRQFGRYVGLVSDPEIGDRRLDDRFVFDGDPQALRQLFAETDLEAVMYQGTTRRAELRDGMLWTQTHFPLKASAAELVEFVREKLLPVARHCERAEVEVRVREAERAAKHFVWVGHANSARCPFCREDLDLEAADLTACPACDTVHHGECFDEHGGCTVLGCSSAPQPEARERA